MLFIVCHTEEPDEGGRLEVGPLVGKFNRINCFFYLLFVLIQKVTKIPKIRERLSGNFLTLIKKIGMLEVHREHGNEGISGCVTQRSPTKEGVSKWDRS